MLKRKTLKRAKTKKTRSTPLLLKLNNFMLVEKIEKEFRHIPKKLIALCHQESQKLKILEKKLNLEIKNKMAKQILLKEKQEKIQSKKTLDKNKLSQIKKAFNANTQALKQLDKQKKQIEKIQNQLTQKKNKFSLLTKEINQFEKKLKTQTIQPIKKVSKKINKKPNTIIPEQLTPIQSQRSDEPIYTSLKLNSPDHELSITEPLDNNLDK